MNRIASTGTHFGRTYLHAIQQSCLYACAFVFGIAVFQARVVSAELESGQAFLVGTPDRLGPLALPTLQSWPRGVAYVFDAEQPDLFVRGRGGIPDGLYVFPWLRTSDQGTPVFGRPKQVESEFEDNGTIFQTPDGQIHGVWTSGKNLVHTRLDKEQLKFVEVNRVEISSLP
ncbi:MAG: hypothetical protein KDA57_17105, partial [Planctomycetales bacterium]|nr:hypothetical protein [Planctomycetales bacterium]